MYSVPVKLFEPALLTASAATYGTAVGANTKRIIKELQFCNTSATARAVTVYLVPSGGSASTANAVLYQKTVGPYQTYRMSTNLTLKTGDFLQALADAGSAVSFHGSGLEVS